MIRNFSDEPIFEDKDKISIFLAGPTTRNSDFAHSWRNTACTILEDMGFNGIVYIPEFYVNSQRDYMNQVLWERRCLELSTYILFWIDRDMKTNLGMTTNVEFGTWLSEAPEKVRLGYPVHSKKMRYLDWLYRYKTGRVPQPVLYYLIQELLEEIKNK